MALLIWLDGKKQIFKKMSGFGKEMVLNFHILALIDKGKSMGSATLWYSVIYVDLVVLLLFSSMYFLYDWWAVQKR